MIRELDGTIDGRKDPLAGAPGVLADLLADLDDDLLGEFLAYWRARHELRESEGNAQAAWWAKRHLDAGGVEVLRRHGADDMIDLTTDAWRSAGV